MMRNRDPVKYRNYMSAASLVMHCLAADRAELLLDLLPRDHCSVRASAVLRLRIPRMLMKKAP
jgi:hypothetical protein